MDIAPTAPLIQTTTSPAPAPTPMGGTIAGGIYYMTNATYYGTWTCSRTFGDTYRVTAVSDTEGSARFVTSLPGGGANGGSWTYKAEGSLLTAKSTCPDGTVNRWDFTATSTQLVLYFDVSDAACGGNAKLVTTLTKQ